MYRQHFCKKLIALVTFVFLFPLAEVAAVDPLLTINVLGGEELFNIQSKDNLQGVAYFEGHYYVGFDVGKGFGIIRKYNKKGALIQETDPIRIGHTAELDFRSKNRTLYVVNGGGKHPTRIFEIDMTAQKPYITNTIDLAFLGNAGLMAIDNLSDTFVDHTVDHDKAPPKISVVDYSGKVVKQFHIPYQGIPRDWRYIMETFIFRQTIWLPCLTLVAKS